LALRHLTESNPENQKVIEELKIQDVAETPEELKEVLKDILSHIRFPIMDVTELAGLVSDSGLLNEEQLLGLFHYVSIRDEKDRARLSCAYNTKSRGGGFLCKDSKILSLKFKKDLLAFFGKEVKKLELKLLYRGSKDGFTAAAFHRCCDNKGATLSVIRAENTKYIFGGYYSGAWNSGGAYGTLPAWLFSLTNATGKPLKILATSSSNNAYCNSGYGPTFGGGHDLHINNSMKSQNNYTNPSSFKTIAPGYSGTFTKELLAGSYKFGVDDLEVFTVITK